MSLHPKTPKAKTEVSHVSGTAAESPQSPGGCRKWLRRFILKTFVIGFIVVILGGIGFYVSQPRYYHILVIGSDQRSTEKARSDVLLLVSIPKSRADQLSLITIPRDTKIEHDEKGLQKITHFYAMWDEDTDRLGNRELTTEVVEELLDSKVHGTVEVTFDSFNDIVDLMGGVDLAQGHVDGDEAEELVHNRFVQPDGDFGRAEEQREIFKGLLPKVYQPSNMKALYTYFTTSDRARLTISKPSLVAFGIAYLIGHRGHVAPGDINEVVLPGAGARIYTPDFGKALYYWELDTAATEELINQYVR